MRIKAFPNHIKGSLWYFRHLEVAVIKPVPTKDHSSTVKKLILTVVITAVLIVLGGGQSQWKWELSLAAESLKQQAAFQYLTYAGSLLKPSRQPTAVGANPGGLPPWVDTAMDVSSGESPDVWNPSAGTEKQRSRQMCSVQMWTVDRSAWHMVWTLEVSMHGMLSVYNQTYKQSPQRKEGFESSR